MIVRSEGSSPRIRGESNGGGRLEKRYGIIPANTGRISAAFFPHPTFRDHPREYGENFDGSENNDWTAGSSPRIRGELETAYRFVYGVGIIPANTGRIVCTSDSCRFAWDHPREYGENTVPAGTYSEVTGSSPRIRGELALCGGAVGAGGIIPANTGRMRRTTRPRLRRRDHPREYGENPSTPQICW